MRKVKKFEGYKVLWLLREYKEPWTVPEICEELNIKEPTAMRHLRELWTFEFIHISGWEHCYQHWRPIYRWGNRPDAPRPKAVDPRICRQRRYFITRLASPNLTQKSRERAQARYEHWNNLYLEAQK